MRNSKAELSRRSVLAGLGVAIAGGVVATAPASAATTTDVSDTYERVITPESFGAVSNGTTDDTAALQAAVNVSGAGQFCYITGSHLVTSPILIPSNGSIRFAPGASVIRGFDNSVGAPGITQPGLFVNAGQSTGGNSNITILGNGSVRAQSSSMTGKMFAFFNVTDLRIEDVGVTSYYGDFAAVFKNVTRLYIEGCKWLGGTTLAEDGIHLYGVQEATIANCIVHSGDDALAITNEACDSIANKNINVTNCHLASNAAAGIKIATKNTATAGICNVNISNCTIVQSSTGQGIWIHDQLRGSVNDIKLDNITVDCSGGSGNGMTIGGLTGDGVNRMVISNVTIEACGAQPIQIQGSTKIDLINPVVFGSRGSGMADIRVDTSTDVKIIGGRTVGAITHGVMIGSAGACTDVSITGMTIDGATNAGVRVIAATGTWIGGNRIKNCGQAFVEVPGTCTFTVLDRNDLRSNIALPSYTASSSGILIRGNIGAASNDDPRLPAAALAETFPRWMGRTDNMTITSGTLYLFAVALTAGVPVGHLTFFAGSRSGAGLTNWWFGLYDRARVQLAVTADQLTAAWASGQSKNLAIARVAGRAAPTFIPTYTGLHYIGIVVAGTTPPSLVSWSGNSALNGQAPILAGRSSAARRQPPPFPFTGAAITATAGMAYAEVLP
jgi:hypothetical protein